VAGSLVFNLASPSRRDRPAKQVSTHPPRRCIRPDFQVGVWSARVLQSRQQSGSVRNVPLTGLLQKREYTRTDIVLIIVTALAVAAFLFYIAFGPMQWS
jgi:hypothetical protein